MGESRPLGKTKTAYLLTCDMSFAHANATFGKANRSIQQHWEILIEDVHAFVERVSCGCALSYKGDGIILRI